MTTLCQDKWCQICRGCCEERGSVDVLGYQLCDACAEEAWKSIGKRLRGAERRRSAAPKVPPPSLGSS
jgi:hypothetical protein